MLHGQPSFPLVQHAVFKKFIASLANFGRIGKANSEGLQTCPVRHVLDRLTIV